MTAAQASAPVRAPVRLRDGSIHPVEHAYRDHYRDAPDRVTVRVEAWRRTLREHFPYGSGGVPPAVVLWEGPSQLSMAGRVVVVAAKLRPSAPNAVNAKTGDMVQIYILPTDEHPAQSIKSGGDSATCGSCPARPSVGGACYVQVSWAPANLWRGWRAGNYPAAPAGLFEGAPVRFGAWGDPAAVPLHVWEPIVAGAAMHTGYTHAWRGLDASAWGWLMASCDSAADRAAAMLAGWRSFRVLAGDDEPAAGETQCPAQAHGVTCAACGTCAGDRMAHRPDVWLNQHGFRMKGSRS